MVLIFSEVSSFGTSSRESMESFYECSCGLLNRAIYADSTALGAGRLLRHLRRGRGIRAQLSC